MEEQDSISIDEEREIKKCFSSTTISHIIPIVLVFMKRQR